ncbi:hypothetical protein M5689_008390 [Euphorbia peplus]|nr:hypothetical protein M5689_008390 [Euphorbia peplus]
MWVMIWRTKTKGMKKMGEQWQKDRSENDPYKPHTITKWSPPTLFNTQFPRWDPVLHFPTTTGIFLRRPITGCCHLNPPPTIPKALHLF